MRKWSAEVFIGSINWDEASYIYGHLWSKKFRAFNVVMLRQVNDVCSCFQKSCDHKPAIPQLSSCLWNASCPQLSPHNSTPGYLLLHLSLASSLRPTKLSSTKAFPQSGEKPDNSYWIVVSNFSKKNIFSLTGAFFKCCSNFTKNMMFYWPTICCSNNRKFKI